MKTSLTLSLLLAATFLIGQHTFSIVAVDTITGEIGSAGATCLTSADCNDCGGAVIINQLIPGVGAVNAQATVCLPNTNATFVADQLRSGLSATDALNLVLSNDQCQFGNTADRQYGIVSYDGDDNLDIASYTGDGALSHAGHRSGTLYSIQGNILLGPEILDSMEARFIRSEGWPLKDRLMEAMQGANVVGADSRCAPDGLSSKSSFLRVAALGDPEGEPYAEAIVESTDPGVDPIDSLQTLVDDLTFIIINVDDETKIDYNISPNPASDLLTLTQGENALLTHYRITTIDGREVAFGNFNLRETIKVENYEEGIYFIQLMDQSTTVLITEKVLIQR